jgi:hypothetical protein
MGKLFPIKKWKKSRKKGRRNRRNSGEKLAKI